MSLLLSPAASFLYFLNYFHFDVWIYLTVEALWQLSVWSVPWMKFMIFFIPVFFFFFLWCLLLLREKKRKRPTCGHTLSGWGMRGLSSKWRGLSWQQRSWGWRPLHPRNQQNQTGLQLVLVLVLLLLLLLLHYNWTNTDCSNFTTHNQYSRLLFSLLLLQLLTLIAVTLLLNRTNVLLWTLMSLLHFNNSTTTINNSILPVYKIKNNIGLVYNSVFDRDHIQNMKEYNFIIFATVHLLSLNIHHNINICPTCSLLTHSHVKSSKDVFCSISKCVHL